jgi:hypothetical protein
MYRVDGQGSSDPDLILAELPGVGLVARRLSEMAAVDGGEMTIEPTTVDEHGRTTPGGVRANEDQSVTWESEEGKIVTPERPEPDARLRRMKLTLRFDASDRVTSWEADPPLKKGSRADGG